MSGSSSDTYEQRLSTGGRLERVGLAVAIAGVAICTLWASQSGFTKLSPIISLGFWAVVSVVLALSVARPRVWLAQFDANRCLLIAPGFELNVTWSQVSDIHVDDGCAIVALSERQTAVGIPSRFCAPPEWDWQQFALAVAKFRKPEAITAI